MEEHQVDALDFDPLDATKIWPEEREYLPYLNVLPSIECPSGEVLCSSSVWSRFVIFRIPRQVCWDDDP